MISRFAFVDLDNNDRLLVKEQPVNTRRIKYQVKLIRNLDYVDEWWLEIYFTKFREYAAPYFTYVMQAITFGYYCGYLDKSVQNLDNSGIQEIISIYKQWLRAGKIINPLCPVLFEESYDSTD